MKIGEAVSATFNPKHLVALGEWVEVYTPPQALLENHFGEGTFLKFCGFNHLQL